jgi:protein TonB
VEYLESKSPRVWPTRLLITAGVLALMALIGFALRELVGDSGPPKKHVVHNIALLRPPPPPPPKPKERPPEPEIKKEEVKVEQPKPDAPEQAEAPPGEQLGVDAEGGAGSDGFGLVGNKGGRDLLSPSSRAAFALYTRHLQRVMQDELAKHRKLKSVDYRVVVRLWLTDSGAVRRVELAGSSGRGEVDAALREAIAEMAELREPPPQNMPQPLTLRITNRGAA